MSPPRDVARADPDAAVLGHLQYIIDQNNLTQRWCIRATELIYKLIKAPSAWHGQGMADLMELKIEMNAMQD
eukprot:12412827-Karenia_brevis.AAC.1